MDDKSGVRSQVLGRSVGARACQPVLPKRRLYRSSRPTHFGAKGTS
jgi:hypothetical protein